MSRMTNDDLIKLGFKPIPHFTVQNSVIYDLGRNRHLSAGDVGTPNEMIFIGEIDSEDDKKITDCICLHNYDYDGYVTEQKVKLLIEALTNDLWFKGQNRSLGCTLGLDYWKHPVILKFNNKLFSDTLVIDFNQFRKEDNLQGRTIVFFFNFKDFSYHWHFKGEENDFSNTRRARIKMETIKYLIKNGFDMPLY